MVFLFFLFDGEQGSQESCGGDASLQDLPPWFARCPYTREEGSLSDIVGAKQGAYVLAVDRQGTHLHSSVRRRGVWAEQCGGTLRREAWRGSPRMLGP